VAIDGTGESNLDFYEKRKKQGQEITLPSVVEDTTLRKLFYFNTVPHEVWINDAGIVIAITDPIVVTDSVIQRMVDRKPLRLPLKYTDPTFDKYKPFLVAGNGGSDSSFLARSVLTEYKPEIRGACLVDSSAQRNRIFLSNRTLRVMYQRLYSAKFERTGESTNLGHELERDKWDKRMVIETKSGKFDRIASSGNGAEAYEASKRELFFCYELILPPWYTVTWTTIGMYILSLKTGWFHAWHWFGYPIKIN
jgi:hypothetical protein